MGAPESLTRLTRTAIGMARIRANESRRPDRLFDDPLARAFVDAAPELPPEERGGRGVLGSLGALLYFQGVIRTRFYDEYLTAAAAGGCRQVILLAAGLDTRAFRLDWPDDLRLFELDLPEVLGFKQGVLADRHAVPRCQRSVVAADLRGDWPERLVAAGFQPERPAAWLAEGLLIYLTAAEVAELFGAVGRLSAPGSQLAFEQGAGAEALRAKASTIPSMQEVATLWKGGLGADTADWLASHGWRVRTQDRAPLAAAWGRPVPDAPKGGFVTAVRGGAAESDR
jgi:methyltransferase (TIGR00027 family)